MITVPGANAFDGFKAHLFPRPAVDVPSGNVGRLILSDQRGRGCFDIAGGEPAFAQQRPVPRRSIPCQLRFDPNEAVLCRSSASLQEEAFCRGSKTGARRAAAAEDCLVW